MKNLHFIGVGGIGMSGLAAAGIDLGYRVSGSDRGAENPENLRIFSPLKGYGIEVYPQDGSRFASFPLPDELIYSTAIEEDNPDFLAGQGISRLHRAELLGKFLQEFGKISIAVTGSCGKSTVSAWLLDALTALGSDPVGLLGALSKRVRGDKLAGNYRPGKGKFLVFEADESDKSLLRYRADYAVILNIGTDHYDKSELAKVFGKFLQQIRLGAVMTREVFESVKSYIPETLAVRVVDTAFNSANEYSLADYKIIDQSGVAEFGHGAVVKLPKTGKFMAVNGLCVEAILEMLQFNRDEVLKVLPCFAGIWRRQEFAGYTANGAQVWDDYAHNPEKILSNLQALKDISPGSIYAVFQPHGYGPFGFMRNQLFEYLENFLSAGDKFILLEPFYAGGTSNFSPTAMEVFADWQLRSKNPAWYQHIPRGKELEKYLQSAPRHGDIIAIMGARDNSLSDFALSLTAQNNV